MATASPRGSGWSRSRESPSQEAQAAQGTAGQQYPQWIDAGREHQCHCSSRDQCAVPTGTRGLGHYVTAGDDQADRQRGEAETDNTLPRGVAEPVP